MYGEAVRQGWEEPAADPHALAVPRRQKSGVYALRALGDARVLTLVEAAEAGDWEAVKAASAPFDLGRDHQVLGELAELDGVQDWIGRAVDEDKEYRASALLISGARHVIWGWEARTSARAVNVSQEQWRVFRERLNIAEEQLLEAAELRPEWVTPWRRLLTSGRGMSLGPAVNETRLDAALRRDPLDLETHIEWVSQLQPRWSGEPGQALAFARDAFDGAPEGHRLGCVIAMAHIEDWVESDNKNCLVTPRRSRTSCWTRPSAASSTPPTCPARAGRRTSTFLRWPCHWRPRGSRCRASSTSCEAPAHRGPGSTWRSRKRRTPAPGATPESATPSPRQPLLVTSPHPGLPDDSAPHPFEPGRRRPHLPGGSARPRRSPLPPPLLQPSRLPARTPPERGGRASAPARHGLEPDAPADASADAFGIRVYADGSVVRVEDDGVGLTEADVHTSLATIGRSSKRAMGVPPAEPIRGWGGVAPRAATDRFDRPVRHRPALLLPGRGRDPRPESFRPYPDAPAVEWRGRGDGSYTVRTLPASARPRPGTTVTLTPRAETAEWTRPVRVRG